jgi:hypothetical protein
MRMFRKLVSWPIAIGLFGLTCVGEPSSAHAAGRAPLPASAVTNESKTVTVRIERPFADVYAFLVDPGNWNQWAFGLGKRIRHTAEGWVADSNGEVVKVEFTPLNEYGVLDHTLVRPSGQRIYVPLRLISSGGGCELQFTLFRDPGMSDTQFGSDAQFVQKDFNGLKQLMEK